MSRIDVRGCAISGATPTALESYERALATFLAWQSGVRAPLASALQEAPTFVMAHVLEAYQVLSSRDPRHVRSAQEVLTRASHLPANDRERLHLAAIAAVLADDYERAKALLGDVLRAHPLDVLALQVAHAFDYVTGDLVRKNSRVAQVLASWPSDLPGYHAVLAMHAFSLEECGAYDRAEDAAHEAMALNPRDARAHHVMAHVFEMTERPDDGVHWMEAHRAGWSIGTVVDTHCWWHVALYRLAQGRIDDVLALYDARMKIGADSGLSDLIDASALLWRLRLRGIDSDARWAALAEAWGPHLDDAYCSFTDLHAMLTFVGAGDWDRARRLEASLANAHDLRTRYGATTRQVGLPAGRALIAFGRGDDARAIALFGKLPASAYRLGGSHAQRDVLHLTMLQAIERIRWPGRRIGLARVASDAKRPDAALA
jgi:tetratricopeptide (TPR) repeat protein